MFQTSCFNRLWKASRVHHSEADNKIPSSLLGPGIRPPDHNQSTTVRTGVIKPWMLGKSLNSWDDLRITRPGYDIHTLRHGPAMAQSKVRGFFPIDSMAHLSSSLHSYVNVYQRLLRCSYGFPMVFPLKPPFSRGTTACCSSKPCRQDSPSRSTKPWLPKRRGCPLWPDVPPESDHRGEVTQCEAPQWC